MLIEGANELTTEELEELFKDDVQPETPPVQEQNPQNVEHKEDDIDKTKAFAKRLKESTDKARSEERESIAKALGYASYEELTKSRERQLIEEKGLDPEQTSVIVDELVKKRLEQDPRILELEEIRKQRIKEFGEKELKEITELTNGAITRFDQLSDKVLESWKKKGSLKSAYIEIEGENLINKIKSEQSKGSTQHLKNPSGTTIPSGKRLLTSEEKKVWRLFNKGISEDDLNKITVDEN